MHCYWHVQSGRATTQSSHIVDTDDSPSIGHAWLGVPCHPGSKGRRAWRGHRIRCPRQASQGWWCWYSLALVIIVTLSTTELALVVVRWCGAKVLNIVTLTAHPWPLCFLLLALVELLLSPLSLDLWTLSLLNCPLYREAVDHSCEGRTLACVAARWCATYWSPPQRRCYLCQVEFSWKSLPKLGTLTWPSISFTLPWCQWCCHRGDIDQQQAW